MLASKWAPYPEYKFVHEPWIDSIPSHWDFFPLRGMLNFRNEKNYPIETDNILSLSIAHGVTLYSEDNKTGGNKRKDDLSQYKIAHPEDIVLNSMNVVVGAVGLSKYHGAISPVYYALYSKNESVDILYYSEIFQNSGFQRSLLKFGKGILIKKTASGSFNTIRMKISVDDLKTIYLPKPPIKEQKSISSFLNEKTAIINKIIDHLKIKNKLLEEKRSTLITKTVTKGLNPNAPMKKSGVEWIDEIPEHWSVKPIKYSIPLRTERLQEIPLDSTYIALEHIESGSGKMIEESQTETVESSVTVFEENDVLFGKLRPYLAKVVFPNFSGVCSNELIVLQTSSKSEAKYFQKLLISNPFIQYVNARTNGVKMPRASPDVIAGIKLSFPPISEINEIGTYLKRINEQISDVSDMIYSQIAKLQEFRSGLISAAVTGKIDVRGYSNER